MGISNRLVFRIHFRVDSMFDSVSGVASGETPRGYVGGGPAEIPGGLCFCILADLAKQGL